MVVKEHNASRQDVLCNMQSDNPSYPCSKCLRRFLLLENNGIELRHPQDEASCHQHWENRPIKEPTMFNFVIPKNEKDVYYMPKHTRKINQDQEANDNSSHL